MEVCTRVSPSITPCSDWGCGGALVDDDDDDDDALVQIERCGSVDHVGPRPDLLSSQGSVLHTVQRLGEKQFAFSAGRHVSHR